MKRTDQMKGTSIDKNVCISLQNITISYGEYDAVRNVFFDIPKDKVTSLIGPSGCGKSTILRALNRMNDLISGCSLKGRILFEGLDLYADQIDPVEVRRRIGMVFQQPNPFPKSIYENIAFGARINGYSGDLDELVERSLRKAAVWDECKDKLNESGYSLSGGQQQRIALARALLRNPHILILDEATSALDTVSERMIQRALEDMHSSRTVIVIAHRLSTIENADEIIVLDEGQIIERGNKEELISKEGEFAAVWNLQTNNGNKSGKKYRDS